jgi:hypothetical protein
MVPLLQYCYVVPAKEGADTFTCCPPLLGQWSLQCMRVTALRYAFIPKRTNALTVLRIYCTYEFVFLHLVKIIHSSVDVSNHTPTL